MSSRSERRKAALWATMLAASAVTGTAGCGGGDKHEAVAKLALAAGAAAINVDFNSTTPQGASPNYQYAPAGAFTGTAAAPDQGTYWNALWIGAESAGPNTFSSGNLIASDSTVTNVTVSLSGFGVSDVQGKLNAGAGVAQALLSDFAFSSSGSATFSIDGLASGVNYDIYLFSGGGTTGNSTTFTIGSQSLTVSGGNAATFDDATLDGTGNYVVFRAVVPTGTTISGTFSGSLSRFSGLQISRGAAPGSNAFNVDFDSTTTQSTTPAYPYAPSGTYSGSAAAPNVGGTWNGVGIGPQSPYVATYTSGFLQSSDGATTNVSVTLTSFGVNDVQGQSNEGAGAAEALLNDFATVGASATTPTFSINGLTNSAYYDLYLYSGGGTLGNSTTFTIGGVSHPVSGGPFTGLDDATSDGTGNYVVFRNLVASSGAISGTFSGSNSRFSGFQLVQVSAPTTQFTYTLPAAATTSAGVYSNGTLVRTLWFNAAKQAGANTATWDNRDDQGVPVAPGLYEVRVLSHNMQYVWDGMVGNSSATQSGTAVMASMEPMQDLAITGTTAFYPVAYNEGHYDFHRFDTGNPRVLMDSWTWGRRSDDGYVNLYKQEDLYGPLWLFATTDGTNVYFASTSGWTSNMDQTPTAGYIVAADATTDSQSSVFTNGSFLPNYDGQNIWYYPKGIRVGTQPGLSGLSVEKSTGPLLAVAVAPDNTVYLRDKLSGDALASFTVTAPKRLAFDSGSRLWIAAGSNVYAYDVSNTSPYTATLAVTLSGFSNALSVAPDATSSFIIVADGGSSMQLKGYNCGSSSCTAATGWPYGQAGGYQTNGPAVTDDKFWFWGGYHTGEDTFVTIAPDGTFWVGDGMNGRVLHMSRTPTPHVIEKLSMQSGGYKISINQTNPRRVFRNFLEFEVDYGKRLDADGAWTLVNNWANVPIGYGYVNGATADGGFSTVATLSNNRTYAQLLRRQTDGTGAYTFSDFELVELTSTGLRGTGQAAAGAVLTNGELLRVEVNSSNGSFEVADAGLYGGWTAASWGTSALTTAVKNTPETATEGSQYLNIRATSNTTSQAGLTLYLNLGQALQRSRTFTVSFDVQDKNPGFDQLFVALQGANSQGAPTTTGAASFGLPQDGAWHAYSGTITVPTSTTQDGVEMRISFIRNGPASGTIYEANLDNVRVTQGPHVVVDRGTQYWYRNTLTGFDASGNPQWSPDVVAAALYEPRPGSVGPVSGATAAMTSTGVLLSYDSSFQTGKHLGGVATNGTSWAWRAFPTIKSPYPTWVYPIGYFDIGAGVVRNAPDAVMSAGRNVVVGYHGEGWNGKQASQFMHFYDDGLFVGQFGQPYSQPNGTYVAPDNYAAGFAGNAFSPVMTTYNGETYVYMNDEWGASLQRYHLVGANTIREAKGTGIAGSTIAVIDAPYCPPTAQ